MIGLVGWGVIVGALLSWEGLGLAIGHEWPTLSHMLRAFTKPVLGRSVLFGMWLWLGWHLFVQGWDFFLRGPLPERKVLGTGGRLNLIQLWSQVILPLLGTYVVFLGVLRFFAQRPHDRGGATEDVGSASPISWPLLRWIVVTVTVGYAVFLAMLGLYVVLTGNDPSGLLPRALTGGALLAFVVVVPGFVLISVVPAVVRSAQQGR